MGGVCDVAGYIEIDVVCSANYVFAVLGVVGVWTG